MKRILVIGSGGAGKSTFAKRLGELLGIEVIHLDALYWQPGWVEPAKQEWGATVESIMERAAWIMDGNYSGTLARRLEACDTVIFLDLPRLTCVWRVLKRLAKYRNQTRPDMATGCYEKLNWEFLLWVWNYPRRTRPRILQRLREHEGTKELIQLRSAHEVERFLAQTKQANLLN